MNPHFISQSVKPVAETMDTGRMAAGEPGLPRCFVWGKRTIEIVEVVRDWRETSRCDHGSAEHYVRKHWYEVRTTTGAIMKIYFERQPRGKSQNKKRWWLFSSTEGESVG